MNTTQDLAPAAIMVAVSDLLYPAYFAGGREGVEAQARRLSLETIRGIAIYLNCQPAPRSIGYAVEQRLSQKS